MRQRVDKGNVSGVPVIVQDEIFGDNSVDRSVPLDLGEVLIVVDEKGDGSSSEGLSGTSSDKMRVFSDGTPRGEIRDPVSL